MRRQIAMLGVIHRSVLGLGPAQLKRFFKRKTVVSTGYATRAAHRRHNMQLEDIRDGKFREIQRRSALGLVWIYNHLPGDVVAAENVSLFQHRLQELVKARVVGGCADWKDTLNPRVRAFMHPLR